MPLSEHEQRQLEQIEQALYREDPKFGRLVRSSDPRVHYKRKLAQALVGIAVHQIGQMPLIPRHQSRRVSRNRQIEVRFVFRIARKRHRLRRFLDPIRMSRNGTNERF